MWLFAALSTKIIFSQRKHCEDYLGSVHFVKLDETWTIKHIMALWFHKKWGHVAICPWPSFSSLYALQVKKHSINICRISHCPKCVVYRSLPFQKRRQLLQRGNWITYYYCNIIFMLYYFDFLIQSNQRYMNKICALQMNHNIISFYGVSWFLLTIRSDRSLLSTDILYCTKLVYWRV